MTKIKICGLSRDEDVRFANACRPDYVGFVFAPKSKRYVNRERAERLRKRLDPSIDAVGVFVDAPLDTVTDLLDAGIIQIAQLHGGEDEDYISRLRSRTKAPIWKAFSVKSREDAERACSSSADQILLDHGAGGTGAVLDWTILRDLPRPFILAGGLGSENVAEAIALCRPFGVDASSRLETDGVKDEQKMKAFAEAVRR